MSKSVVIAVDAMGGENAPNKILTGISEYLKKDSDVYFKIFGKYTILEKEILKNNIAKQFYEIINCEEIIEDNDTPLSAAKKKNTSMWQAINDVKEKKSNVIVSAGNTGALFVISKLNIDMIENINKPALAALWPNKIDMNIVLDLGANVECNEKNFEDFAIMGAALHKSLFPRDESKVALLNIGSEEIKGHETIKKAYQILDNKKNQLYEFCGYIEGNQIMDGNVNVIVTDGFTGNIALKTAEGTSNFISSELKKALSDGFFAKLSSLLNISNLKKFKKRLDPRLYNGAIFLGLESPVIKSHGSTDYIGFANSIDVCVKTVKGQLIDKIKKNIII
mgnify:CR=1 FL=1|tara:strand:+ start:1288 stop:2295 length:1008 start_codon:yes stop_codon:yes gene_type:complete